MDAKSTSYSSELFLLILEKQDLDSSPSSAFYASISSGLFFLHRSKILRFGVLSLIYFAIFLFAK